MAVQVQFEEERAWYHRLMPDMPSGGTLWFYGKKAHLIDKFLLDQSVARRYSGAITAIYTERVPGQKRYACVVVNTDDVTLEDVIVNSTTPENIDEFGPTFHEIVRTLVFNHESLNTGGLHFTHHKMTAGSLRVRLLDAPEVLRPNQYPDVETSFKVSFDNLANADIDASNPHLDFRALGASICGSLSHLETAEKTTIVYTLHNLGTFELEDHTVEYPVYKLPPVVASLLKIMVNLGTGELRRIVQHYLKGVIPTRMMDRCVSQFGPGIAEEILDYALTWNPPAEFRGDSLSTVEHGFLFSLVNHARLAAHVANNIHTLGLEHILSVLFGNFAGVEGFNASALVAAVFSESPYAFSNVYDAFKIAFARPNEIASEHAALDYRLQ